LGYVFFVDSTYREVSAKCRKEDVLDTYITMRKRFANTFCQMMDYDLGVDKDPRCLMISSALLMDSAISVMNSAFINMEKSRTAAFDPNSNVIDLQAYDKFLDGIGATAIFAWNFFKKGVQDKAEGKLFVKLIQKLSQSFSMIKEFSGRMVEQNGQKFMIMADANLRETVEKLIQNIKSKKIIESLKDKGAVDIANKMNTYIKEILNNIKQAEAASNRLSKNKGNAFKPLDLSDNESEVSMLRERVASEEFVAI